MYQFSKPRNSKDLFFHIRYGDYPITHTHREYWEFMFIFMGDVIHKINGQKVVVQQDSLCLIRPSDVHSIHAVKQCKTSHLNLGVTSHYLKEFLSFFDEKLYDELLAKPNITIPIPPAKGKEIMSIANTILLREKTSDDNFLKVLFLSLVGEITQRELSTLPSQYSKATSEFLRLLDNPDNYSKSLNELFASINYSYSHMNRTFLQEIGSTPSDYFRERKIEYAKILLTDSNFSMIAIAEAIGYKSAAHFSTAFKKATGQSPSEYKSTHGNNYIIAEIKKDS